MQIWANRGSKTTKNFLGPKVRAARKTYRLRIKQQQVVEIRSPRSKITSCRTWKIKSTLPVTTVKYFRTAVSNVFVIVQGRRACRLRGRQLRNYTNVHELEPARYN